MNSTTIAEMIWSGSLFFFSAASVPQTIPKGRESSREYTLTSRVMGMRLTNTSKAGTLGSTLMEVPQSPSRITPLRKYPYCTIMGSFRWSLASSASSTFWGSSGLS